jgi:hypothetical protein
MKSPSNCSNQLARKPRELVLGEAKDGVVGVRVLADVRPPPHAINRIFMLREMLQRCLQNASPTTLFRQSCWSVSYQLTPSAQIEPL